MNLKDVLKNVETVLTDSKDIATDSLSTGSGGGGDTEIDYIL